MNLGNRQFTQGGSHQNKQQRKQKMNELPSLYVSNLPKENFFDLDFYKFFTSKGYKVKKAKIVIDSKTNKSRGYGYLQFVLKEEAERCLNEMNNTTLNGLALRIMFSSAEPKYNENANLLVKNIALDASQQEIFNLFKSYGNIISAKLETYPNSKDSRGFAYIQFQEDASAEAALAATNNLEFKGKKLEVSKHKIKEKKKTDSSNPVAPAQVKRNNLFVKQLPPGTDDAKLKALFAEFGAIESAQMHKDAEGTTKDYGYVCFKDSAHADAALKAMDKKVLPDGKFLIVNYHVSKKEGELNQGGRTIDPRTQGLAQTFNSNVYIKFIPLDVTEEQLRNQFSFGDDSIVSLKMNTTVKKFGEYEVKSQYAYILYNTVANAQKAIQRFDNQNLFGSPKPIHVEMWVSKEEKEQERKRKEDRQVKQVISGLMGFPAFNQFQGGNRPQNNNQGGY